MPRTRTVKKGNRKGNRNVSRGNKYTLNRLKERNRKRKMTRLRRGPNRNNYNNLPKRTRKQSAGTKYLEAAKSKVASKATEYRKNFGQRLEKNFGKECLILHVSAIVRRVYYSLAKILFGHIKGY